MPYTTDELVNLEFYQEIARRDEIKYLELIENKTESGIIGDDGILRDPNSGYIILFENIIPGQGTGEIVIGYPFNYLLSWIRGWFIYEETEDTNKIIDREFTEF